MIVYLSQIWRASGKELESLIKLAGDVPSGDILRDRLKVAEHYRSRGQLDTDGMVASKDPFYERIMSKSEYIRYGGGFSFASLRAAYILDAEDAATLGGYDFVRQIAVLYFYLNCIYIWSGEITQDMDVFLRNTEFKETRGYPSSKPMKENDEYLMGNLALTFSPLLEAIWTKELAMKRFSIVRPSFLNVMLKSLFQMDADIQELVNALPLQVKIFDPLAILAKLLSVDLSKLNPTIRCFYLYSLYELLNLLPTEAIRRSQLEELVTAYGCSEIFTPPIIEAPFLVGLGEAAGMASLLQSYVVVDRATVIVRLLAM